MQHKCSNRLLIFGLGFFVAIAMITVLSILLFYAGKNIQPYGAIFINDKSNIFNVVPQTKTPPPKTTMQEERILTPMFEYTLRTDFTHWDQELVRASKQTKQKEVVIASVKTILPELRRKNNFILTVFAQPADSEIIIFRAAFFDTDNPTGVLYQWEGEEKRIIKMKTNNIYNGFGGVALSPDQSRIVWTSDTEEVLAQELYLINLVKDTTMKLVTLQPPETFNGGYSALSMFFDITWPTMKTVRYAVFDQSKKINTDDYRQTIDASLIEYRTVSIP